MLNLHNENVYNLFVMYLWDKIQPFATKKSPPQV